MVVVDVRNESVRPSNEVGIVKHMELDPTRHHDSIGALACKQS